MAGRGSAPKDPTLRQRRNAPMRGDWLVLPEVVDPVPDMPARDGGWLPQVEEAWRSWWSDPASTQWGPAQQNAVLELLVLTSAFWGGEIKVANEMRLRQDALGLTEKGKRDLRWRLPTVDEEERAGAGPAKRARKSTAKKAAKPDPYAKVAKRAGRKAVAGD